MKPKFFFQKIFDRSGTLFGIELLAREVEIDQRTDLLIFFEALRLLEKVEFPCRFHVNLFPSSVRYVDWKSVYEEFGDRLVVEIIEQGVHDCVDALGDLLESGVLFALDDFDKGSSNFSVLSSVRFPIVKVDASYVYPGIFRFLKDEYGVEVVIAEKSHECPADAFQSFALHIPEPFERLGGEESACFKEGPEGF